MIDKIKEFGILETIAFIVYIVLILTITMNHECYEDEAQSWLIARDLNFIEIVQQMKYEGHSFLWLFLIAPFAKLGFPVEIQSYIASLFAIATVYLILKKSPFNKLTKVLLTFSGGMLYFYSILARPYCMIPFLLACIAIFYKNKKEHPYIYALLIVLLAHTHLVMLPTVGILMLLFFIEELIIKRKERTKEDSKKLWNSFLLMIIGVVIYLLIVIVTYNYCAIVGNFNKTDTLRTTEQAVTLLKDTYFGTINYLYGDTNTPLYYKIIVAIVLILCLIGSKNNLKQAAVFWSQLIFTLLVHMLAWFILPTRVFITIYTLMFWAWNEKEEKRTLEKSKENRWIEIALIILIILSIPSAGKLAIQDIKENFSTGKIAAQYIEENIPEGSCFVYVEQELQQSILANLKKDKYQLYMPNSRKFVTFTTWDEEWNALITSRDVNEAIDVLKKQYKDLYMITGAEMTKSIDQRYYLELLFDTKNELMNNFYVRKELFCIYKIHVKE